MRRIWVLAVLVMSVSLSLSGCSGCGDSGPEPPKADAGNNDAGNNDVGPDAGNDVGPDADNDMSEPDLDHNEILSQLGVTTNIGPRLDPAGNPLRADYNPFGKKRRTIHKLSEIYLAGVYTVTNPTRYQVLLDDATNNLAVLHTETADDAWTRLPKVATAGDIDGDAREEVVMLIVNNQSASSDYKRLYLRIIGDAEDDFIVDEVEVAVVDQIPISTFWDLYKLDVATGDIDGDGRDEIVASAFGTIWVFDDARANYRLLYTKTFPVAAGATQYVRVAMGDTNGNGRDELVVVDGQISGNNAGTARYTIYNQALGIQKEGNVQVSIDAVPYQLAVADVEIGDVDGDGLGEIVFCGRITGSTAQKVLIMDDGIAGYEFLPLRYDMGWGHIMSNIKMGDFDGDGRDEIVAYRDVIDDVTTAADGKLKLQSTLPHDVLYGHSVTVGDINNDWRDDIVYITGGDLHMVAWGTNSAGVYGQITALNVSNEWNYYPAITTVNTDGDSAILEFEAKELLFTDPRIIAVLAAPPSFSDVPMDLSGAGTSFGRGSSTGVETEHSIGFSVGASVGTEFEDRLFTQSKVRFMVTVEMAMDWTATQTREVQKSYFYNGTGESDKVVFTTIPFDVYYYRVISSPVPAEIGTKVVVNLPREPQTFFVDRDFYNANNGRFLDIGPTVLGHTIGVPSSYPTYGSINPSQLGLRGGAYSDAMTVGQGPGSQRVEINIAEGQGSGTNFDLSVTIEFEGGAGGIIVGGSSGFHYGYSYRVTSTQSTFYSGTVGNILLPADWTASRFDFGLFIDPVTHEGQKFPVIRYWVD